MSDERYRQLCALMAQRGGRYPGMDIPEFYEMTRELFTPEEAALAAALPPKPAPAGVIARETGKKEGEVAELLEAMASKGLCSSFQKDGSRLYMGVPFVPGIFEFQFMRGTRTDRDREIARLIHSYKQAVDAARGPQTITFPANRVIPVGETIRPDSKVHTYNQVSTYIDNYAPIAVSTCFCRHEGKLLDEKSDCGKPDDVCMQFGLGASFVIERGMGRKVNKEEARGVLKKAAEAGLVHASMNTQEIDFICNCCSCHCMILKTALSQPKPGRVLYSGFQPRIDPDLCTGCEVCVDRCPAKASAMEGNVPEVDGDRCFGCGVCATGCPAEAIVMEEKLGVQEPPLNRKALRAAMEAKG
ncbi:MAG: 4Fe-4S dicluster domain-containing protein [Deltaproteobacteria bacterium]|nr:4Fe-4S dicluster domain-containing protein [Deltaproteobacteria bacterium]